MVAAVAHQVGQRVGDLLDQALVEFGRLAQRHELDLLAELGRQIPQHAREAAEHHRHRNHPDRHHRFLQVAGVALQVGQATRQLLVQRGVDLLAVLRQHRLGNDEFADQVDELIDLLDRDAQGRRFERRGRCLLGAGWGTRCRARGVRSSAGLARRAGGARGVDRRTRCVVEEAVARIAPGEFILRRRPRRAGVEAVAVGHRQQRHLLARDVEGEQVQQVGVAAGRDDTEAPHAVAGMAPVDRLDRPEVGDLLEQLDQVVGLRGVAQRADPHFEFARLNFGRCRRVGVQRQLRARRGRRGGRRRRGRSRAGRHRPDARQQLGGVDRVAAATLVACQLGAQGIARLQQHVDHGRGRHQFAAAQLVEQRLHLVRQFGHVGEAEGGRAALDGMRTAEDRVQLLVVGGCDVDLEQLRFHAVEVLARLFEKDLVELAQVDARADVRTFCRHVTHAGSCGFRGPSAFSGSPS